MEHPKTKSGQATIPRFVPNVLVLAKDSLGPSREAAAQIFLTANTMRRMKPPRSPVTKACVYIYYYITLHYITLQIKLYYII